MKEKIKEATDIYGRVIVEEAITLVSVSDPDGAYIHAQDYGRYETAECIEFLFFDND